MEFGSALFWFMGQGRILAIKLGVCPVIRKPVRGGNE
jgi:hypothetical protein